jgi:hypothetical protein
MLTIMSTIGLARRSRPVLGDSRATLRRPVTFKARVRDRSAARFEIKVVDLSLTGLRGETMFTLTPDTSIWIMLPGLASLEAKVAWQRMDQFGARFLHPLHPAVFEHIASLGR